MMKIFANTFAITDFNRFSSDCFINTLYEAMVSKNIKSFAEMEKLLISRGYTGIHRKRISAYLNGTATPSYEKARAMLTVLDWDITDQELINALEENRRVISEPPEPMQDVLFLSVYGKKDDDSDKINTEKEKRISIRLKYTDLVPGKSSNVARATIRNRIEKLYGDPEAYGRYIRDLMKADLANYIFEELKEFSENEN